MNPFSYPHLFHPLFVHFPIVLTPLCVLLILFSVFWKKELEGVALFVGILSALSAILALLSGEKAYEIVHQYFPQVPHSALEIHEEWGERSAYLLIGVSTFWLILYFVKRMESLRRIIALFGFTAGLVLVILAGRYGGDLVYQHGAGVLPMADPAFFLEGKGVPFQIERVPSQPQGKEGDHPKEGSESHEHHED